MANIKWKTTKDILEKAKYSKSEELSTACKEAIETGFTCKLNDITYHFSYDLEDQTNLQETQYLFDNRMIDQINWNARLHHKDGSRVRLQLVKEQFYHVYMSGIKHKLDCISKFRDDLSKLIDEAQSEEELEKIAWDSVQESTFRTSLKDNETIRNNLDELRNASEELADGNKSAMGAISELFNLLVMSGA